LVVWTATGVILRVVVEVAFEINTNVNEKDSIKIRANPTSLVFM
jgi:hypothetical protein